MSFKHKQIINLFTDPKETMSHGLWFSGVKGEGELKSWWNNGQLWIHGFYKNHELNGEYKEWYDNGQLYAHKFYKNAERHGEYKQWYNNGELISHKLYKNDKAIEDYL